MLFQLFNIDGSHCISLTKSFIWIWFWDDCLLCVIFGKRIAVYEEMTIITKNKTTSSKFIFYVILKMGNNVAEISLFSFMFYLVIKQHKGNYWKLIWTKLKINIHNIDYTSDTASVLSFCFPYIFLLKLFKENNTICTKLYCYIITLQFSMSPSPLALVLLTRTLKKLSNLFYMLSFNLSIFLWD